MKKNTLIGLIGISAMLSFSGCGTSNMFGVGHENSACDSAKDGGFCGAPSSIYKYKEKIKQMESDYQQSGYPEKLFFSVTRNGDILVKQDREDKWQPYENSRYKEEINNLLKLKYDTKLGSSAGINKDIMDIPVGDESDLSVTYKKKKEYLQTKTNVGKMIRDTGEYSRTWVAPYVDQKGDLISAHEMYTVIKDPQWVIGEKTPSKVVEAATPTPMSDKAYGYETELNKPTENSNILNTFLDEGK